MGNFLNRTLVCQEIAPIDKWDFMTLANSVQQLEQVGGEIPQTRRMHFFQYVSGREVIPRIYKELKQKLNNEKSST